MGTKSNPGLYDCYAHAAPEEDMFILLGRDRHASALVRLWALMREKEGEPAEVVAETRATADKMEAYCRERGKIPLPLDSLLSLAAALRPDDGGQFQDELPEEPLPDPLKEGEIVVAGRSLVPAKLVKIFKADDPETVRGKANIMLPRGTAPTTVDLAQLRRAFPEELKVYRAAGGR